MPQTYSKTCLKCHHLRNFLIKKPDKFSNKIFPYDQYMHYSFCMFPNWKNFPPKQYENSGHDFTPNKYVFASIKITKFPIRSICYQCNSNETNSMFIHKNMVGNDVTFQLQCRLTLAQFTWHDATSWLACYLHINQHEFYGVCCD
jgi:hypothetical protein